MRLTLAEVLTGLRELPDLDAEVKVLIFQQIALGLQQRPVVVRTGPPWDWARDT